MARRLAAPHRSVSLWIGFVVAASAGELPDSQPQPPADSDSSEVATETDFFFLLPVPEDESYAPSRPRKFGSLDPDPAFESPVMDNSIALPADASRDRNADSAADLSPQPIQLGLTKLTEDDGREEVEFEAQPNTESVYFAAADRPAEEQAARNPGSALDSESFTTDDSLRSNVVRLGPLVAGRINIQFGAAYVHDSNPSLLSKKRRVSQLVLVSPPTATTPAVVGTETSLEDQDVGAQSLFIADLSLGYRGGAARGPGIFYSIVYGANMYSYESSSSTGNLLDQDLRGVFGVRGGYTEIRGFARFAQDSGTGFTVGSQRREIPRAKSTGYETGVDIKRRLASGSLEFGAAIQTREFEASTNGVSPSDRSRTAFDAAWFYDPPFTAHTTFGFGLTSGRESFSQGADQRFFTPSLRARWGPSAQTRLGASFGMEQRSFDAADRIDPDSRPVYGINASWRMRTHTSLSLGLRRRIQQSYAEPDNNVTTTTASVALNQGLGGGRSAVIDYRYEFADYDATTTLASTRRSLHRENFHQFGASLVQRLDFESLPDCALSIFYKYNTNLSDSPEFEFEQHLLGLRVGLEF